MRKELGSSLGHLNWILFGALELPHSMSSIYWWTAEMSFLSKRDVLFLATLV